MIRILLICLICIGFISCAAPRDVKLTAPEVLRVHAKPLKIFSIGYWDKDHMVLTLTDAVGQYLTVFVARQDSLKVGAVYIP